MSKTPEQLEDDKLSRVVAFASLVLFAAMVALILMLLSGCRFFGENQKTETQSIVKEASTGAVDAGSNARTDLKTIKPYCGDIAASGNSRIEVKFPDPPKLRDEQLEEISRAVKAAVTEKTVKTDTAKEETQSPWFWFIIAISAIMLLAVAEYIRYRWFGGVQFINQKKGGEIALNDVDQLINDFRGKSTNSDVVSEFGAVLDIIRKKKLKLQLKKRNDQ